MSFSVQPVTGHETHCMLSLPVPLYEAAKRQLAMVLLDTKQVHDTVHTQKTISRLMLQQVGFPAGIS